MRPACGCTEALAASIIGLVDPGDEVVLIEPFYDSNPAGVAMAGGFARYVTLRPPDFRLDERSLGAAVGPRTKLIIINTPHDTTGRVLGRDELELVATACREHDIVCVSDEVYEHMVHDGDHVSIATLDSMWQRTLTLSSLGKTFSLTGWKVGWAIGPGERMAAVRKAHQFLTFANATPLQWGAVAALDAPDNYYEALRESYVAECCG
ncbi:MAG: aminotransferase class I/II-fold pyridoxal phosphate-dependent enzyme [Acidimicrobiia bacterium]|nr:aminotransferase class I/II-fold pyridoxal phosphate-dependent enzyme [Acidimicrobiia bacterium]